MKSYIPAVTVKNVSDMPFKKLLKSLRPYVSEQVPEGVLGDVDAYQKVEEQLGRFANLYAYMIELYAFVSHNVRVAKRSGDKKLADELTGKRDAIYELARAVKYKYDACSRMLTAVLGFDEKDTHDSVNVESRKRNNKKMKGWANVS